jgi:hypothetical protein
VHQRFLIFRTCQFVGMHSIMGLLGLEFALWILAQLFG